MVLKSVLQSYSSKSTAHGIAYIFERDSGKCPRIFWTLVVLASFILSGYMIFHIFKQWQDMPIMTTVQNTGLPISEIDFPAIAICGSGTFEENIKDAYARQILSFFAQHNSSFLNQTVISDMRSSNALLDTNDIMAKIMTNRNPSLSAELRTEFYDMHYPGLVAHKYNTPPDVLIFKLLTSKNPTLLLQSVSSEFIEYGKCLSQVFRVGTNINDLTFKYECPFGTRKSGKKCFAMSHFNAEACPENMTQSVLDNDALQDISYIYKKADDDFAFNMDKGFRMNITDIDGLSHRNSGNSKVTVINDTLDAPCINVKIMYDEQIVIHGESCFPRPKLCEQNAIGRHRSITDSFQEHPCAKSYATFSIDKLLNPATKKEIDKENVDLFNRIKGEFEKLDIRRALPSLFSVLAHSSTPCGHNDQIKNSVLKKCFWKGREQPCELLFSMFPTDLGMCCVFNLKSPEDVFQESDFTQALEAQQNEDLFSGSAFFGENAWNSTWIISLLNEVVAGKPIVGTDNGLSVVLDAQGHRAMATSVTDDFNGFKVMVGKRDSFPLMRQNVMALQPGHEHFIAISAAQIISDRKIESISPEKRLCYFEDEQFVPMMAHRNYTQANCLFECMLEEANESMNHSCVPWYFPPISHNHTVCNPFEATQFKLKYSRKCQKCLPDCQGTTYKTSVSHASLRRCDSRNMNNTKLCHLESNLEPKMYHDMLMKEYHGFNSLPAYVTEGSKESNVRRLTGTQVFPKSNENYKYDAYEEDMAIVHFYFSESTLVQYQRSLRYTIMDFFSQVGGLLGLFIGFSLCSVIEIGYWFIYQLIVYATCNRRKQVKDVESPDAEPFT